MNSQLAQMTRIIACQRAWMNSITLWLRLAAHSDHSRKYVSNSTSIT
uniref:Alternative protein UBE4A n=1 Tax=Homo sapiens TaxID=9606 RepID=L8E7Q1_HUMAN|nr:alternative protein UBE4A [Homo sapiens]